VLLFNLLEWKWLKFSLKSFHWIVFTEYCGNGFSRINGLINKLRSSPFLAIPIWQSHWGKSLFRELGWDPFGVLWRKLRILKFRILIFSFLGVTCGSPSLSSVKLDDVRSSSRTFSLFLIRLRWSSSGDSECDTLGATNIFMECGESQTLRWICPLLQIEHRRNGTWNFCEPADPPPHCDSIDILVGWRWEVGDGQWHWGL